MIVVHYYMNGQVGIYLSYHRIYIYNIIIQYLTLYKWILLNG